MFQEFNQEKSKYETGMILGYLITGLAFVLYIPLGMSMGGAAFFIIGIPFIGGTIIAGYNQKRIKNLSNQFKEKYVTEVLKKEFPNASYNYAEGFTEGEVIYSGLLKDRDRFHSEDMIEGIHENVNFKCCDVTQKEVRSSGKSRKVVTVFQGRFYEFDFHKKFNHNLLLLQPYNFRPFSSYKKLETESIHFNSELKIYAENEHEAFYILTPDFMEKIMYFDQKYFDKISFSFKENKLYIAIDSRMDSFDIKAFRKIDEKIFEDYQSELLDIKDLIHTLNLNQTIFD